MRIEKLGQHIISFFKKIYSDIEDAVNRLFQEFSKKTSPAPPPKIDKEVVKTDKAPIKIATSMLGVDSAPLTEHELIVELENWQNTSTMRGNKEKAIQKIRECFVSKSKDLDLSGCFLTGIPSILGKFNHIEKLSLNENNLKELPPEICNLTKLKCLNLNNNYMRVLPQEMNKLSHLQKLGLEGNQLLSLPESIGNLEELEELSVKGCPMRTLPSSLSQLKNLKDIYVNDGTDVKDVPREASIHYHSSTP